MIDFSNYEINNFKYYGGRNGGKICIKYNNEDYMLKFPGICTDLPGRVYSNNCISEYISCEILKSIGYNVQDTLLGKYTVNKEEKIVVACRDFTTDKKVLKQFAELKNSQVETSQNGYGTELDEVIYAIEEQSIISPEKLKDFFWDMFIGDCLIGNFDRHNGNWGFLINANEKKAEIAPIYDCASCLYPQLTDELIKEIINDKNEMEARIYVFPNSALKINDKKINYFKFINELKNEDCNQALLRIFPKIELNKIFEIIDKTPYISNIRKEFYKIILEMRYEKILEYSYIKLVD